MNNSCKISIMALFLAVIAGMSSGLAALYFQVSNFFPILGEFTDSSFMVNLSQNHARMMVFFVLQPALMIGFGAWLVPILIGAKEMAFAKANYCSLLFLMIGFCFNFLTFFKPNISFFAFCGLGFWAVSAILFSANMIVTIVNYRAKEKYFSTLPFFVWSQGIAAVLLLPTASLLLAALTRDYWSYSLQLGWALEKTIAIFAYPMVMILLVPSFGVIFHIVQTISNHSVKQYTSLVSLLSVVTSTIFLLWNKSIFDHSFWNVTQDAGIYTVFAYILYALSLYLLVTCMRSFVSGKRLFITPVLWSLGFVVLIAFGWLYKGIPQEMSDIHSCLSYAVLFTVFAGFYLWMGKLFGKIYSEVLGQIHFGMTSVGVFFMLNFFNMGNISLLIGLSFLGLSLVVFCVVLLQALKSQVKLPENYWGEEAVTDEWQLPSPVYIRVK